MMFRRQAPRPAMQNLGQGWETNCFMTKKIHDPYRGRRIKYLSMRYSHCDIRCYPMAQRRKTDDWGSMKRSPHEHIHERLRYYSAPCGIFSKFEKFPIVNGTTVGHCL